MSIFDKRGDQSKIDLEWENSLKRCFRAIDTDHSNEVSKAELIQFLVKMKLNSHLAQEVVEEIFNSCDKDHNGGIDVGEFVGYYKDTKNKLWNSGHQKWILQLQLLKEIKDLEDQKRNWVPGSKVELCTINKIQFETGGFAPKGNYIV